MPKSLMSDRATGPSETQSKSLLSLTRELLAVVSADGRFLYANESFERVLGYSAQDLLGTSLTSLHPPAEAVKMKEKFASILEQEGAAASYRCSLRAKSGQWRWFDVMAVNQLHDPDVQGILISYQDVTEFHRLEAQRM